MAALIVEVLLLAGVESDIVAVGVDILEVEESREK
jgi:hypothetical protein